MAEREDETLYEVTGIVGGPAGKPLAGVRVVVWWRQIRELRELAVGETFEDGRYRVRYALPEDAPGPVLIVVEALSEFFESRLFSQPTPAAPRLEIDLAFEPRDESQWATLVRAIEPLLDGLELDELVESDSHQDLTFLSRELGKSTEELMQVALSARLARQFDLPAPVFYAFLDQRVPASLPFPLLDASQGFTLVDSLVQDIASLVFALAPEEQESTLTAAVALDLIGPKFTRRIPALVEELQSLRSTDLLSRPYASGTASLSQLLDVAGLLPETQQTFANLLAANDGPLDDFWSTLEAGRSGLSADEAEAVERVLSIGSLAGNYVPLVQAVDAEFAAGRYSSLSQVATLTLDEWTALVAKSGVPEGTEAGASDTPEAAFAKAVYTRAIRAFPTVALSSRIASAGLVPKQEQAPLERFFANNPDLELVTDNLALYLDGAGKEAFGGIPAGKQAKVVAAARGFQRVLRVSPDADVAQALIVAGITSASQIANAGRAQFAAVATEAGLSAAETSLAYEAAAHRYATVVAKYMQLNADAVGVLPKMIGDLGDLGKTIQGAVKRDQSLAALFGSQDYCAVEDCTSVLGPAAYLCDLLLWLKNHPQGSHTALDTFDARRPDVRQLLLNCPNSDTELPYVDLVNELLADTIAPPSGSGSTLNPIWKQTSESATAEQLRAAPEYFNQDAYVKLHGASYPQSLPYSTGLDELRTYLQSWNLPLWQLREALLPLAGGSVAQQAAVAAERLGMNRHAEHLVVTPNAVLPAVAWNTSDFSATAPNGLATVPVFLQASSLDYESLLELLEVSWVQNGLGIHLVGLNDTCDTTGMALALAPLDTGFLDRSNRFLRLWLATGYKMWELDLLLNAPSVGNGKLDRKTLVALQAFWELQAQTKLEVDEQLALYQDLDVEAHLDPDGTTTTTSRYAQVFLNPTTTWAAPDPELESLPHGGPIGDPALADHVMSIQRALAVSAAENATLFTLSDGMLTLANLSLVYRVSLLATASRLAIADLLTVATLLAPGAASQTAALEPLLASPAATLDFLGQATAIQQSSLSLDALTYLLTPPVSGAWTTTSQMAPTEIATTLGGVQQAIVTLLAVGTTLTASIAAGDTAIDVASGAGFPAAPFYVYVGSEILQVTAIGGTAGTHWTVARGRLGTTAAGAAAGAAVTPTSGDMDGAVVAAVAAGAHTATAAPLANDVTALILGTLEVPGTGKTLLAALEDPALVAPTGTVAIGGAPAAGDTLTAVITDVSGAAVTVAYTLVAADAGDPEQTAASFAAAIVASAAVAGPAAFLAGCTASGAVISLTALTPAAPGTSVTCSVSAAPGGAGHVTVSPDEASLDGVPAVSTASFPDQFTAIQLVDKVGILVRGLRLVASDLSWLLENAAAYGGTDLIALPVTAAQPALPLTPLLTTLLLLKQERSYISAPATAAVQTLYDLIGGVGTGAIAAEADAQAALAAITGWPVADIEAFSRALELSFPASYTQPEAFSALRDLEVMSQSVDTSGPVVSAGTTLVTAIDNVQTSITVASAIGFPTPEFYVSIGAEILLVSAVGGADDTNWTVARGRQGTTAGAAGIGAIVTPTYGAQLVSWGAVPHDEVVAEALAASALGVLKAQQPTDEAWLTLAPTLMDPIRDRRSAALRAYLTAKRSSSGELVYPDDDALFDYFLIDVEMSSCQVTSRVVQAYIAVQIFVERCLMNLETTKWDSTARGVIVDLSADDTWNQWEWMKRYRIWEANREVFLFPENWLIESQRPNRTEIYEQFEQNVRQGQSTADYLETTVLDYIESLDHLSHLLVTGTARDPATGTIYVIARTIADPPTFYSRSYADGAWSGWAQIPLDIKAHQAIPAVYRGRECVFWLDVKVQNEPKQTTAPAVPNEKTQSQNVNRYVSLAVNFSIYSNGSWGPPQVAKGSLFDKPTFDSSSEAGDPKSIEALYTLKVQSQPATPGLGTSLYLDVFRLGTFSVKNMYNEPGDPMNYQVSGVSRSVAIHLGRAVFDGRVSDLELANVEVPGVYPDNFQQDVDYAFGVALLTHAKQVYGPDAQPLIPLTSPDPNLTGESGLLPVAGALAAFPSATGGAKQTLHLSLPGSVELLGSATLPVRVVGPSTDLALDPRRYFFFQDNRRCYFVEAHRTQETERGKTGKARTRAPFELTYRFRPFYHPFTRLAWNQLGAGGFDLLYDPELQLAPDAIDPSYPDVFSFKDEYDPTWRVTWDLADATTQLTAAITASQVHLEVANAIWVPVPPFFVKVGSEQMKVTAVSGADRTTWAVHRAQNGTTAKAAAEGAAVTPIDETRDRQFLDFGPSAPFSVYNWELFYHVPRYIADLLSQNQQFEDAQTWYRYIFDPTGQGPDPVPERFWIPKPLRGLTSAKLLSEQIETLLTAVNEGDAGAVGQVTAWRNDPFNPFVLADLRPVAYMKSTVMAYLDNLIAWADNLFASESREALSVATLIYVIASEILGPEPTAVTPPPHADMSFDQLEPLLDAFANAMVEIENVIGPTGEIAELRERFTEIGFIPRPQTFYFKIPPNDQLLGYWGTVDDRLYKLRHCESIAGAPLELALFDAPIDPGLLIAARAAGVDLSSGAHEPGTPRFRTTASRRSIRRRWTS